LAVAAAAGLLPKQQSAAQETASRVQEALAFLDANDLKQNASKKGVGTGIMGGYILSEMSNAATPAEALQIAKTLGAKHPSEAVKIVEELKTSAPQEGEKVKQVKNNAGVPQEQGSVVYTSRKVGDGRTLSTVYLQTPDGNFQELGNTYQSVNTKEGIGIIGQLALGALGSFVLGPAIGAAFGGGTTGAIAGGALSGGITSELGGGDFLQGAALGAAGGAFNTSVADSIGSNMAKSIAKSLETSLGTDLAKIVANSATSATLGAIQSSIRGTDVLTGAGLSALGSATQTAVAQQLANLNLPPDLQAAISRTASNAAASGVVAAVKGEDIGTAVGSSLAMSGLQTIGETFFSGRQTPTTGKSTVAGAGGADRVVGPVSELDEGGFTKTATNLGTAPPVEVGPADVISNILGDTPETFLDDIITNLYGNNAPASSLIDSRVVEEYKQALRTDAAKVQQLRDFYGLENLQANVMLRGIMDVASGAGIGLAQAAQFIGKSTGIQSLENLGKVGGQYAQALAPANPEFIDKALAGIGSVASFFVPGAGAGRLAGVLGAGVNAARSIGAGTSALLEATTVAQETYNNAMSQTGNEGVAMDQAYKALVVTLPATFLLDKIGMFAEGGSAIRRVLTTAGSESGQEGQQQVTSNVLGYQPAGAGVTEAAAIGGIAGGSVRGATTVGDILNSASPQDRAVVEAALNNAPPTTKAQIVQDATSTANQVKEGIYKTLTSNPATAQQLRDIGVVSAADDAFNNFMKTITGGMGTNLSFLPSDTTTLPSTPTTPATPATPTGPSTTDVLNLTGLYPGVTTTQPKTKPAVVPQIQPDVVPKPATQPTVVPQPGTQPTVVPNPATQPTVVPQPGEETRVTTPTTPFTPTTPTTPTPFTPGVTPVPFPTPEPTPAPTPSPTLPPVLPPDEVSTPGTDLTPTPAPTPSPLPYEPGVPGTAPPTGNLDSTLVTFLGLNPPPVQKTPTRTAAPGLITGSEDSDLSALFGGKPEELQDVWNQRSLRLRSALGI
jgi:hypothetical protein